MRILVDIGDDDLKALRWLTKGKLGGVGNVNL
jgi:hypothetical protein